MNFDDVVHAWDDAAMTPEARQHIHPAGNDEYEYEQSGKAAAEKVHALISHDEPPTMRQVVLDFGCGDGRVASALTAWHTVIAADASPMMLERLHDRHPKIPTVLSNGLDLRHALDAADLPKPDVIVCLAVLIHHSHVDARGIISGLSDALQCGGMLVLDLPLYDEPRERQTWNDVSVWTAYELADFCEFVGLVCERAPVSHTTFDYDHLGEHHGDLVVLRKPR